ncbi:MAG: sporulation transcriptional regulator SpoIIID [Eubacteriales bacterium]|nr:sporulation transcriptional regulator SpoIIID [Eubacteriales bacterium]
MNEDVRLRVMRAAETILETGATVRACAGKFGVSKTTIHKDMRQRLPRLDSALFRAVDAVLRRNLQERHLRGGAATRRKYRGEEDGGEETDSSVPQLPE